MSEWIKRLTERAQKEAMDPVDKKELKGKHKDRKDKDIDNDGDVDSSDEYLHKRRKAISQKEAYEGVPTSKPGKGGPQDEPTKGLSPSAKDQLKNKTPTPEPADAEKVHAKNFKDFRKGMKTAAKRTGDNDKGDKNVVK
ncbi:hypothetical protein CMO86_08330 [Candidatus Woesearchaeota archaeon]|jgi:hypothetical protein|nr:hypothetical protein [Candidatus Woesearchaeota archaeon]|tara:strand:- start:2734 stop:3150 length:417 start_codon:yes stop_codon:yes gene_type:complete